MANLADHEFGSVSTDLKLELLQGYGPHPTIIRARIVTSDYWGESTTGKPYGPSRGGIAGDAIANWYFTGVVLKDVRDVVPLADEQ